MVVEVVDLEDLLGIQNLRDVVHCFLDCGLRIRWDSEGFQQAGQ